MHLAIQLIQKLRREQLYATEQPRQDTRGSSYISAGASKTVLKPTTRQVVFTPVRDSDVLWQKTTCFSLLHLKLKINNRLPTSITMSARASADYREVQHPQALVRLCTKELRLPVRGLLLESDESCHSQFHLLVPVD